MCHRELVPLPDGGLRLSSGSVGYPKGQWGTMDPGSCLQRRMSVDFPAMVGGEVGSKNLRVENHRKEAIPQGAKEHLSDGLRPGLEVELASLSALETPSGMNFKYGWALLVEFVIYPKKGGAIRDMYGIQRKAWVGQAQFVCCRGDRQDELQALAGGLGYWGKLETYRIRPSQWCIK